MPPIADPKTTATNKMVPPPPPPPPPFPSAASPPPKPHLLRPSSSILSAKLLLLLLLLSLTLVLLPLSIALTMPSLLFPTSSSYRRYLPPSRPFFLTSAASSAASSASASFPLLSFLRRTCFNQTLMDMASVDLAEPEERRQIGKILDGSWLRKYSDRLRSHHVSHREDYSQDSHRQTSVPSSSSSSSYHRSQYRQTREREQKLPLQLSYPRYEPHWGSFKRLVQGWISKKRHDPKVMSELLRLVKEPIDRHYMEVKRQESRNATAMAAEEEEAAEERRSHQIGRRYGSCAVVGNSGILLNQSHGEKIDSHEMVMRLNNARIHGFEEKVGTKTTISFVNSNILHMCERRSNCFCHPYGSHVPLVMYICQVVHFMDIAVCSTKLQAPIVVTDARFDTLCSRIVKYYSLKLFAEAGSYGYGGPSYGHGVGAVKLSGWSDAHEGTFFHYSSGMQAVLLAIGICDRVSLFGFGKTASARHHYHSLQKEELKLHDYEAEYQFYKDLTLRNPNLVPFLEDAGISIPPVDIYW